MDEAREEGARHSSIEGKAIDGYSICEGYQIREGMPLNIKGEVEDEGLMCATLHVWVCMTRCLGEPKVEDPK